jgi:hypothetical protein
LDPVLWRWVLSVLLDTTAIAVVRNARDVLNAVCHSCSAARNDHRKIEDVILPKQNNVGKRNEIQKSDS